MQVQVPPELQYNQLQSRTFFSVFKNWPIQPIANQGQYFPGEVIRVFLNALTDGVMDPYKSHLEITVSCDAQTLPVGLLQVDNSAQSFIQQLVISSRNRQVQRIIQYGCIAGYLTDVGLSEIYTEGRQTQGLGYSNISTSASMFHVQNTTNSTFYFQQDQQVDPKYLYGNPGIFPTIPYRTQTMSAWGSDAVSLTQLNGSTRGHISYMNPAWFALDQQYWWYNALTGKGDTDRTDPTRQYTTLSASLGYYGYANNMRAQYLSSLSSNLYIDNTNGLSMSQARVAPNVMNNTWPAKFGNNTQYNVYIPENLIYYDQNFGQFTQNATRQFIPNSVNLFGFTNLYGPAFSKGVNQPFISPTVPQCQIQNGVILPTKLPISQRTFKIPLISAVMGLLIPQSQFVLIPLRTLNDSLIEITIDPYAMFTSGYNDISQYDDKGMGLMQQRAFTVDRVVYNLHTYQFYTPQMDQYLKININSGIAINTHVWQLGNQYQIQNSQSIGNSWPVACNQQALNQILVLFYPLDYQQFSFCRKHFRISNNILRLQLRINMQYFPSQPLSGNGGNPIQFQNSDNNSIFLEQIYQSNGYFFNYSMPLPRINAFNFALNDRPYNIMNTNSLYDTAMIGNKRYNWTNASVNYDTALGMPNIHQNRCVGKAAYLFSFEPYSHSKDLLTGIDCRKAKQFDVIFATGTQNPFPRSQMMLIYTRSSNIIQYGKQGIVMIKS